MTYNEIMQSAGKEINPSIYYTINGTTTTLGRDDIKSAKVYFNAPVLGTIMSGLSVEIYDTLPTNTPIYFKNVATLDTYTQNKVYGPYYVKDTQYNADTRTYSIELYDEFLPTMVDYQPITIIYPTTIYDFFIQLVSELNLTTSIASLPNGSLTMDSDIYEDINYTYRNVLDDIAQATASRFKISNGEIELAPLGTTTISIDDDILKNQNIEFGEHFGPINTIVLSRSADSDSIYYPDPLPANPKEFRISDNQLMNGNDRDTFMSSIYNELNGLEYDIYDTQLVGYGGFNPLDLIEISTVENETTKTFTSYVFNNEQTFTQGYEEVIYTELPEATVSEYSAMSSTDKLINQTNLIVNKQENRIEGLVSEQDELEGRISQTEIEITSQGERLNVMSTNIDPETGDILELKRTGYEMGANGLIIDDEQGYKSINNTTGLYYYDNDAMTGKYTKDGGVFNDLALFGRYYYGIDAEQTTVENFTKDDAMFVSQRYVDNNNEVGVGHFYNGD